MQASRDRSALTCCCCCRKATCLCTFSFSCYDIPNANVRGLDVVSNRPNVTAYRGPGAPQGNYAFEAILDEIADELGIDLDKLNPNGGAIALGHPLGMTGARILLAAARQLQRTGGKYGLVTLCIGVGQGYAAVIENVQR